MLYLIIYFLGFEISMVHMHEHKHIWWTSNLHGSIRMSHMLWINTGGNNTNSDIDLKNDQ